MKVLLCVLVLFVGFKPMVAQKDITVMCYNVLMYPDALPANREDTLAKILKLHPVDILGVCELITEAGSDSILKRSLNKNTQKYKAAHFVKATKGDLHQMLYYNSEKLTLYSQNVIPSNTRDFNEYTLYANTASIATGDTIFLDVYVCHLKAGNDTTNERLRSENVQYLMDYINGKPQGRNRILMGDFNVYSDQEVAYQKLTKGSIYPFYDPIDQEGNWHNNSSYKKWFTQSTRSAQLYGEGSGGGVDDRFDFILTSNNILDTSNAVFYKENTYKSLGNDGDCFNKNITDCGGDAELLSALYYMSDHLPVVMDLELKEEIVGLKDIKPEAFTIRKMDDGSWSFLLAKPTSIEVYTAMGKHVYNSTTSNKENVIPQGVLKSDRVYFLVFPESGITTKFLVHSSK